MTASFGSRFDKEVAVPGFYDPKRCTGLQVAQLLEAIEDSDEAAAVRRRTRPFGSFGNF